MEKCLLLEEERHSGSSVQSIQRASAILRALKESDIEPGVTLLSQRVGMHKSTVSRMLSALRQEGFVEQNPESGKWRLGLGLLDLAGAVLARMDLRGIAQVPISELAAQTKETVNISVLDGDECVNIIHIPSPKSIKHTGRLGRRTPLHCTSTGKVFLAFLTPQARDMLVSGTLQSYTEYSIVNREILEQQLALVREQDYATANEEFEEGLSAVAAPIRDHTGQVVAAISISGPSYRMGSSQTETFVTLLKDTAQKISTQLGYQSAEK